MTNKTVVSITSFVMPHGEEKGCLCMLLLVELWNTIFVSQQLYGHAVENQFTKPAIEITTVVSHIANLWHTSRQTWWINSLRVWHSCISEAFTIGKSAGRPVTMFQKHFDHLVWLASSLFITVSRWFTNLNQLMTSLNQLMTVLD